MLPGTVKKKKERKKERRKQKTKKQKKRRNGPCLSSDKEAPYGAKKYINPIYNSLEKKWNYTLYYSDDTYAYYETV